MAKTPLAERSLRWEHFTFALIVAILTIPQEAFAYVGPGAGIAFLTTVGGLLVSLVIALSTLIVWPVRQLYRLIVGKRPPKPPQIERAVIVGLDGLDPDLVEKMMKEGRLPNLKRLGEMGTFDRLETTYPAMSPVAWSTFATGVNPSKHGIFDFITRDPHSYLPDLSSAEVRPPTRNLKIGKWQIPIGKPVVRLRRKSAPFWNLLTKYQVPCSILRVPITFPPQPFDGTLLSAMCVPDLQGSQGTFTYISSAQDAKDTIGGQRVQVELKDGFAKGELVGPANPLRGDQEQLTLGFSIKIHDGQKATLKVGSETVELALEEYSDWTTIAFPLGLGLKLRGICRFRLMQLSPELKLYMTPIHIDPSSPVLPVSHPLIFSVFLAKLMGRFGTLGLAEDTWALNEGVIDEKAFLEQAWGFHREREAMFFEMLERTPKGLLTCVFDGTDRIQHMFMRFMDEGHPAEGPSGFETVIEDTYAKMDEMIGRVIEKVEPERPENLLMVISDHGFKTFRRGVNLNSWLLKEGYLFLEEGRDKSDDWLRGVDWSKTRAFAIGLGGIFLNVKGRESQGIVAPEDANALADELCEKLTGLMDEEVSKVAIQSCYPAYQIFDGPYAEDAPDLIVGYCIGWRHSWDGTRGLVNNVIFDDNTKAWSGDHCIDPKLVPGTLISSRPFEAQSPAIADIAPTVLNLFGVPAPRYMDGQTMAPSK